MQSVVHFRVRKSAYTLLIIPLCQIWKLVLPLLFSYFLGKYQELVIRWRSFVMNDLFMSSNTDFVLFCKQIWRTCLNPFQPSVAFHIEASHLICTANQMQHWVEIPLDGMRNFHTPWWVFQSNIHPSPFCPSPIIFYRIWAVLKGNFGAAAWLIKGIPYYNFAVPGIFGNLFIYWYIFFGLDLIFRPKGRF